MKQEVWARIDKGWKIYDPLPQTAEEEVMWKQFAKDWEAWKVSDAKITETISALANNKSQDEQKQLFVKFYKQFEDSAPLFHKAEDDLDKIIALNVDLGDKEAKNATARMATIQITVPVVSVVGLVLLLVMGLFLVRSILAQLGGEPAYVADILKRVAGGDLTVVIETRSGDNSSMLAELKNMVAKLFIIISEVRSAADNLSRHKQKDTHFVLLPDQNKVGVLLILSVEEMAALTGGAA